MTWNFEEEIIINACLKNLYKLPQVQVLNENRPRALVKGLTSMVLLLNIELCCPA